MDALALLCTLHADGPTSLKRLRASGCSSIDALVAQAPDDLADALDVERAVARRLLREARLLAERVGGGSLDPEEAPPVLGRAGQQDVPSLVATPPAPQESALDATDRALVERLSRPEVPDTFVPDLGDALVPKPATGVESGPEPDTEPESVVVPLVAVVAELEPEPERVPGALETGRLPGLDDVLIEDLKGLGIGTYDDLSRAESLELTRGLGITFAQARRLRFLARRAAEVVGRAEPGSVPPTTSAARPDRDPPQPVPLPEPEQEEQGVRIDPAEIEPRVGFAEQFARAAAARNTAETRTNGRTVLGWNFEIPRPEADSLPFASISAPAPLDRDQVASETPDAANGPGASGSLGALGTPGAEDDIAGPFARA